MKKFLFALLVVTGFAAFAPKAEAGHYARVWEGCRYAYYHQPHLGGGGCVPKYYENGSYDQPVRNHYYQQPVRNYYSKPVRNYYSKSNRSYRR